MSLRSYFLLANDLFVCFSVCLSVCFSVCVFLFVFLSVCLSVCFSVCLIVCLSICLSVCQLRLYLRSYFIYLSTLSQLKPRKTFFIINRFMQNQYFSPIVRHTRIFRSCRNNALLVVGK